MRIGQICLFLGLVFIGLGAFMKIYPLYIKKQTPGDVIFMKEGSLHVATLGILLVVVHLFNPNL
jgi:hypothetical protein